VLIQTHQPDARLMRALVSGEAAAFYEAETATRADLGLPPFGRLAALIVSGEDEGQARGVARALGEAAPQLKGLEVLGPAPAPLARLRGRWRFRLLVKAERRLPLSDILRDWLAGVSVPSAVRVVVDVDPYSFV
jgi:primosomal protein N' (replication factor Y)